MLCGLCRAWSDFLKAFLHRPLLAPGGQIAGRGWAIFAAVQQDLLVLRLKGRWTRVVCLGGKKGLSPWQGWQGLLALSESHFVSSDFPGLLQESPCSLAGSVPAQRNPTWGVHRSRNHSQAFSPLVPLLVDAMAPLLLL